MDPIAVFGAGHQAAALLAGFRESGAIARDALFHAVDPAAGHRPGQQLATICAPTDPRLANAGTFLLSGDALTADSLPPATVQWTRGKRVLSAIPGLTLRSLRHRFPEAALVARFACSDAVRFARGVSVHAQAPQADPEEAAAVGALLGTLGHCFEVVEEELGAAATVLGAGPPLLYELAAAIVDAATADGLDPLLAHELAIHSLFGAGAFLEGSRVSPEVLLKRTRDADPEGAEALDALEERGFRTLIRRALATAATRRKRAAAKRRSAGG